jgi:hypothetical protein
MLGNVLEATIEGKPVLILAVFNATPKPKLLVLKLDSKLAMVDMDKVDVAWHYDERLGWVADSEAFARP